MLTILNGTVRVDFFTANSRLQASPWSNRDYLLLLFPLGCAVSSETPAADDPSTRSPVGGAKDPGRSPASGRVARLGSHWVNLVGLLGAGS
jgi:hypothetical protein